MACALCARLSHRTFWPDDAAGPEAPCRGRWLSISSAKRSRDWVWTPDGVLRCDGGCCYCYRRCCFLLRDSLGNCRDYGCGFCCGCGFYCDCDCDSRNSRMNLRPTCFYSVLTCFQLGYFVPKFAGKLRPRETRFRSRLPIFADRIKAREEAPGDLNVSHIGRKDNFPTAHS